eukprot:6623620-Prymnesium_polylepis.1
MHRNRLSATSGCDASAHLSAAAAICCVFVYSIASASVLCHEVVSRGLDAPESRLSPACRACACVYGRNSTCGSCMSSIGTIARVVRDTSAAFERRLLRSRTTELARLTLRDCFGGGAASASSPSGGNSGQSCGSAFRLDFSGDAPPWLDKRAPRGLAAELLRVPPLGADAVPDSRVRWQFMVSRAAARLAMLAAPKVWVQGDGGHALGWETHGTHIRLTN